MSRPEGQGVPVFDHLVHEPAAATQQPGALPAICEAIPLGLSLIDADLRVIGINRRMATAIGWPAELDVTGHSLTDVAPILAEQLAPSLRQALRGEPVANLELRHIGGTTAGEARAFLVSLEPVREADGTPAAGAKVQFQLYNYAELFPLAELITDERGEVRFTTGYGDLIVRAVRNGAWGQRKIRIADGDRFEVVLSKAVGEQPVDSEDFELVPPPELDGPESEPLPAEKLQRHEERVAEGAALRRAYEETFLTEEDAKRLAAQLGLPADRVWKVLEPARGNSREIAAFLEERVPEYGEWPLLLLESLREKDLTDTMRETLTDHLTGSLPWKDSYDRELFVTYVMCPRVLFEMITPYQIGRAHV